MSDATKKKIVYATRAEVAAAQLLVALADDEHPVDEATIALANAREMTEKERCEADYHLAGTAYCDCERGADHEGDAEADAAWDEGGWVGLEQLYVRRNRDEIDRLRAERDAAVARAEDLSEGLRAMARQAVAYRRELRAESERHGHTHDTLDTALAKEMTAARRYREALQALVELAERLETDCVPNEDYDRTMAKALAALEVSDD